MRAIWVLGVWVMALASAQAEQVMVESLEYRVAHADRVIIGTVQAWGPAPKPGLGGWHLATVTVQETLRGPASKTVSVLVRSAGAPWKVGAQVLTFLVDPQRFARLSPPTTPPGALMADLGSSSLQDPGRGAIPLTGRAVEMVTRDGRMLRTRPAVLQAIRAAAKAAADAPVDGVFLELDLDQAAHSSLYAGSGVDVKVPLDARLLTQARAWIVDADPRRRAQAVQVFAAVKGPEGEARLRSVLADPATATRTVSSGARTQVWYIREQAVAALKARGILVKRVALEAPMPPPIGAPRRAKP